MSSVDIQIVAIETALPLAGGVARALGLAKPTQVHVQTFSNGQIEVRVTPHHPHVVLFQMFPDRVHDRLFELLLTLDSLRGQGGRRITAVLPHLPYARSDRPAQPGGPVPARLVAELMEHAGMSRLITVEPHTPLIGGCFRCPVFDIPFVPSLARHLGPVSSEEWTVVSPDPGGARRAEQLAKALNCPVAVMRNHRDQVLGEVAGRRVMLIDDEITSGQTLFSAADLLRARGARRISLAAAHASFTPEALDRLAGTDFERVIVSDSNGLRPLPANVEVVSMADAIAGALRARPLCVSRS